MCIFQRASATLSHWRGESSYDRGITQARWEAGRITAMQRDVWEDRSYVAGKTGFEDRMSKAANYLNGTTTQIFVHRSPLETVARIMTHNTK
jgi:hypothetical protein